MQKVIFQVFFPLQRILPTKFQNLEEACIIVPFSITPTLSDYKVLLGRTFYPLKFRFWLYNWHSWASLIFWSPCQMGSEVTIEENGNVFSCQRGDSIPWPSRVNLMEPFYPTSSWYSPQSFKNSYFHYPIQQFFSSKDQLEGSSLDVLLRVSLSSCPIQREQILFKSPLHMFHPTFKSQKGTLRRILIRVECALNLNIVVPLSSISSRTSKRHFQSSDQR